ncbi:thioredoxin family protein [Lederbergia wuyishanensis]|uniref:Thiol-disulfide isomerase/thioredoxin n=1 Tax=Lederbergia wuyishanensis TaxID=1347903 RepID=A0ABU0CYL0_9BACI|nr:thioredoxin family protein [Lederbergia wuyishanensis]MCJ8005868.1 thioredoxin family protein [Lederbergia wuyishanensis]MDQ0341233.1 thiol-disulfide isomerase/thioredoxin [Lederbergia wuyishanensis]
MKKVVIFLCIIIALFAAISLATKMQQSKKTIGNIYGKSNLHPLTIDQLDNPLYQNLILPAALNKKLEKGEDAIVYFYSPECSFCMQTTPILNPVAEEMKISVLQYNLLEFKEGYNQYKIEYTPTLIYFIAGREHARIVGLHTQEEFEDFFTKI